MGIFTRFTVRTLAKNRVRTAVTVAGIALSTALLAAVLTSVASVQAGLCERTLATEGSWHVFSPDVAAQGVEALAASDDAGDVATFRELGSAALSDEDARYLGDFVAVKTLPTVVKGSAEPGGAPLAMMPELAEGRLPQTADEIILPDYCEGEALGTDGEGGAHSQGPLGTGSEISLDLGRRVLDDGGETRVLTSANATYRDEVGEGYGADERMVDVQERSYTVVGFYKRQENFRGSNYAASSSSIVAITAADADAPNALTGVYLTTRNLGSFDAVRALFEDSTGIVGEASTTYHTNLFRYLGIMDDRPIWGSLWALAAVLAAVIVVASVSLIYNAFAISVAERTRQFGLLASLGASKRQLRRTVLAEALILGSAGVPIGLVLGVAGTAGVFAVSQEAFSSLFGAAAGLPVHVDAAALAAAAALSIATLVVSAWVPAARASRVPAVDAIRQSQDVRLSRRAARSARAAARPTAPRKGASTGARFIERGLAGKIFGVPGFVAHRTLSRSASHGRTVVASLAVSTMLIVITGSIALYLDPVSERAESQNAAGSGADVIVSAHATNGERHGFSDLSDHADELDAFIQRAGAIEGIELIGVCRQGQADSIVPASMITDEARVVRQQYDEQASEAWVPPHFGANGDYYGDTAIFYLDDASWRALVNGLGLDEAAYTDAAAPRAIGLNAYQGTLADGSYISTEPFASPGTLDLYAIRNLEGYTSMGTAEGDDGRPVVNYLNQASNGDAPGLVAMPTEEVSTKTPLEVGALSSDEPAAVNAVAGSGQFPAILLPESVAANAAGLGDYQTNPFTYSFAGISYAAEDHAKVADELKELAEEYDGIVINVSDVAEGARQDRLVSQAVQLFVFCFSIITALIAVANVFNTLANSIILRTREFAVLRSAGMGNRAFARMLAYECASYALRGLGIGLAAALAATYALHEAMAMTFSGLAFTLPWASIGLAVGVVLAVLALSVVYALRRAHAASIVDALRSDAI